MRMKLFGFGPLEAMLALGLILMMGFSTVYLWNDKGDSGAPVSDAGAGSALARGMLDSLREATYASISAGCDTVSRRYIRRWYVTTDRARERKRVELLVSWPLTAEHTLTFNTLIGSDEYKAR